VTTWTKTVAERLIFGGKKVTGVEVMREAGEKVKVFAGKEVLVCSGVQGSAKLLLLRYPITSSYSGILLSNVLIVFSAGLGHEKSSKSTEYLKC
jgi:hypothetical protein